MSEVQMRPRFKFSTSLRPKEILKKIQTKLKTDNKHKLQGVLREYHLLLKFDKANAHFWSPQLDITVEHNLEDDKTLVRCLIGPEPKVWTLFLFGYGVSGIVSLFATMLGSTQMTLNHTPWGFWVLPFCITAALLIYVSSLQGKNLAKGQMQTLKLFLDEALNRDCFEEDT